MSMQAVLLPLFVQVVVTLVVLYVLGARRFVAVRGGKVRGPVALREPNWPTHTRQAEYNYQNQFELPVLFYVLTILVIMTKQADLVFVLLAWIFVATRALHAFVHLTSNRINHRASSFVVGAVVLTIMWIVFMVRFLLAAG